MAIAAFMVIIVWFLLYGYALFYVGGKHRLKECITEHNGRLFIYGYAIPKLHVIPRSDAVGLLIPSGRPEDRKLGEVLHVVLRDGSWIQTGLARRSFFFLNSRPRFEEAIRRAAAETGLPLPDGISPKPLEKS